MCTLGEEYVTTRVVDGDTTKLGVIGRVATKLATRTREIPDQVSLLTAFQWYSQRLTQTKDKRILIKHLDIMV